MIQVIDNNTLALLLIERYSKSLQRLHELREVSSTSSVDTIFATIAEARKMVDSVRQMERDFKKVLPEYEGSSRLAYRDWFIKYCGQKWPLFFHISAPEEEIILASIPRRFRAEYASNLEAIGRTLDDITHSLAFVFGFEKVNYLALRECFKPEARGTNDCLYNSVILPEIQTLVDNGLLLKEWGAVACILQNSKNAITKEVCSKSFDAWCKEFLSFVRVPFKRGSVPRWRASEIKSEDGKFARLKQCLRALTDS